MLTVVEVWTPEWELDVPEFIYNSMLSFEALLELYGENWP